MAREDSFRTNVLFAISSNLTVALVSALTVLIIPKFIGVEEYGYWQLFVFYASYALLAQIGIGDGANLRYGGLRSSALPSHGVGLQALSLSLLVILVSAILFVLAPHMAGDGDRVIVIQMTAVYTAIINIRHYLLLLMQATANFRTYSRITILDRILFSVLVILLLLGETEYWLLAGAEIASKAVSLVIAFFVSRSVLVFVWRDLKLAWNELVKNIYAGLKLTIANTSNMLILGVSRFLVDRAFGIAAFGAVSLVLNLSSFFMVFVSAVGLVLFPTLRRSNQERLPALFASVRLSLSIIPLALLVLAFPLMKIMEAWLPEYRTGLQYLVLLMPMIAFEARMGLLVTPFLKSLRKENVLLGINLLSLILSATLSFVSANILESLDFTILSIVISLGARAILAEAFLLKALKLSIPASSIVETILVFSSIGLQLLLGGSTATIAMTILLVLYILTFRKSLVSSFSFISRLLRRSDQDQSA